MGKRPSDAVVETLAAANDTDPVDLEPPLYESIDLEALDALVESTSQSLTLEFTHAGHTVRVDESGAVTLVSADYAPEDGDEPPTRISTR
ncbi:hypothetical protein D8Y22_11320 [Salinadaptatus halalkaliphilus]|uniref:Halobacterial output domain-containing protein n=1 Tax=Salinadaptatus halalkaliphilus TaxID=2419781 RepID=A0A4S3TM66_9EURY|nr:HalOD1 output domain-containing protein [Salinadaptatus halalkaliphilus]THE64700.1 hypothetical protein D8Y22_11320 [Salinadaptatus halalkaliphilus]